MKKIYLITLLFTSIFMFGQTKPQSKINWTAMNNNEGATFYQVQENFNSYWKDKTPERGKGYKPFKRWEDYMTPRVYPSGNMNLPSSTYTNYVQWEKSYQEQKAAVTSNWTELGPVGSPNGPSPYTRTGAGRLNFVRFDPSNVSTMYVGAPDGGLWKSTNSGASWTTNTDFLAVIGCSDLAIAPNGTTMYLATGDIEGNRNSIGILKSTDGGATWNPTSLVFDPAVYPEKLSKLLMDPNNPLKMVAASSYGAYYTTDGWATYSSSVFSGSTPDLKDMEFKPGTLNANTVYASGTGFYKSTDFGANWTEITNGLPTSGVSRIALAVTADDDTYVYALYGKSSDESYMGTYRSTDNGSTFSTMSTAPNLLAYTVDGSDAGGQAFFDLAIVASPTDKENITIGGVNHWRSFDGGVTWENTSVWDSGEIHADVHEIVYQPSSSTTMYSCNDGGLFVSYDNGNQWTDISNNLTIGQVVKLGLSAYTELGIVAGEQDNGTVLNESTGWYNINGGDGGECFIDPDDDNYIYVQYVHGAYGRSADGGATITPIVNGLPSGIDFYSPFKMHPTNTYTLFAGGTPTLYTSVNYGDNWSALGTATGTDGIKEFAVAPSDPTVIYTVQIDAISKSTNSGTSFTNITAGLPTSAAFSSVAVSTTDANKVWVTYSGYDSANKVYKSVDGGSNWTNISAGLPNVPMNTIVYRNNGIADEVYLGADIGVFIANNNVTAWQPYRTSLPNVAIRDLEIFYPTGKLRAGTYGRGIWESNLNNQTLGIENNTASNNSVFISMDENNNLLIKSSLQDINKVVIFDILGKKVFEKEKINANVFNNPSMVRSQRVLFVKTTLSNGEVITNKILF